MKNFPTKSYRLESPLPPEEIARRLEAQLAEGKEYHGHVSGLNFTMRNLSKLPSLASGTIAAKDSGSVIAVKVEQQAKLTLGELVLMLVLCGIGALFFPDLASIDQPGGMVVMVLLILGLYGLCFYSEIEQSRGFLAELAEVPVADEMPQ